MSGKLDLLYQRSPAIQLHCVPLLPSYPPAPNFGKTFGVFVTSGQSWAFGNASSLSGAWLADTGRNATGVVGALDSNILPSGVFFTDGRGVTAVSSGDRSIVKMDLSKQWKGHVGTEFSPEHIWQPAILYLGRPAQV